MSGNHAAKQPATAAHDHALADPLPELVTREDVAEVKELLLRLLEAVCPQCGPAFHARNHPELGPKPLTFSGADNQQPLEAPQRGDSELDLV